MSQTAAPRARACPPVTKPPLSTSVECGCREAAISQSQLQQNQSLGCTKAAQIAPPACRTKAPFESVLSAWKACSF